MIKIALGIPTYAHFSMEQFNIALHNALQDPLVPELKICLRVSDSLVMRARNNIAHIFLSTDADALLFIDSDIIFTPAHIRKLIDHGKAITCGCYAKKHKDLSWVASGLEGEAPDPITGLQKIKESGTGFMMIHREVFDAIIHHFPEIAYHDDDRERLGEVGEHHDFFSAGVVDKRYLSEDWYFCHRARQIGYDIFLDTRIILGHMGLIQYPLEKHD